MTLTESIELAQDLTGQLREALAADRLDVCASLIPIRAAALAQFETNHRQAAAEELAACQAALTELRTADRELQLAAETVMAATGHALRGQIGASPRFGGSYDNPPEQACLDRKA